MKCQDCGHCHSPNGCVGEPTPSDLWAGVSPAACDCDSTPTEREAGDVGEVAAVLAVHEARAQNLDGDWMCACGSFLCPPNDDRLDRAHREHIATIIERGLIAERERAAVREWIQFSPADVLGGIIADAERAARARALREAADRMPAFHDRDAPEWAIASACRWLRDRATALEDPGARDVGEVQP